MRASRLGILPAFLGADLRQAWRRALALGPGRLATTAGAGLALVAGEVWVVHRLGVRLHSLPEAVIPLADLVLVRAAALVCQLCLMVTAASAVTLTLPILEEAEVDPWWGACPMPAALRALQTWWRVLAGLAWVVVIALPLLLTVAHHVRPGLFTLVSLTAGVALLVAAAAAGGVAAALILAALVPRRVLLPLSWSAATAAVVGAVLWLRHLHPERLITEADPLALLSSLATLGGQRPGGPAGWAVGSLVGEPGVGLLTLATAASLILLAALWSRLAPAAAFQLASGTPAHRRPSPLWRPLDRLLPRTAVGALVRSRLRLLVRDTTQAAQTLYLLGLSVVYVENLRSLPLDEPLAKELAGLINLGMAGLLSAALALRFAYPALLLEGQARWWWSSGPVSRWHATLSAVASASARACFNGLPTSSASIAASESIWLAMARPIVERSRPRSAAFKLPQSPSSESRAAATASSISVGCAAAISAIGFPVDGFSSGSTASPVALRQTPPIKTLLL